TLIVTFSVLPDIPYSSHGRRCQFANALCLPRLSSSRARIGEVDDCRLHQRPGAVRGVFGEAPRGSERSAARRRARIHPGIIFEFTRRSLGGKKAFGHPASLSAFAARWKDRQGSDPE